MCCLSWLSFGIISCVTARSPLLTLVDVPCMYLFADNYKSVSIPDQGVDDPDGPADPDAPVDDGTDLRLRELTSRLRTDLQQLLLFNVSDHQVSMCSLRF